MCVPCAANFARCAARIICSRSTGVFHSHDSEGAFGLLFLSTVCQLSWQRETEIRENLYVRFIGRLVPGITCESLYVKKVSRMRDAIMGREVFHMPARSVYPVFAVKSWQFSTDNPIGKTVYG